MKILNTNIHSILFLFTLGFLVSCSTDDSLPVNVPTTISVYDFSKSMEGNPPAGFEIGSLLASTNQGTVTYLLESQSPQGALSVDATTGTLKVADPSLFDYETHPLISATAKVVNGEISETINITITIINSLEERIFDGIAHLKNQAEIDAFGANNYTLISGTLNIGNVLANEISDINSLLPLSSLKHIGNNLIIGLNPELQDLQGLDNVKYIESIIFIERNENLTSIQSLTNASGIYNAILISGNNKLRNLDGLESLKITTSIDILNNSLLENIDGLSGAIRASEISITDNPLLNNINGLQNMETIDGKFTLINCPLVNNLNGLSQIKRISGSLTLDGINSLVNLNALQNLEHFPISLNIQNNDLLESISIFSPMESAFNITISENPSLRNLEGLNNIINVRNLKIENNIAIQNLAPLSNLKSADDISISENPNLENIEGLSNLESVIRNISIANNASITNLNGLQNLLLIGFNLNVTNNRALTDFCGLQPNLLEYGLGRNYNVSGNANNPTKLDIINGNCAL